MLYVNQNGKINNMTRLEKLKIAIDKGYTCNPETGEVFGVKGKLLKSKTTYGYGILNIKNDDKQFSLKSHQFIWYCVNKEIVEQIDHIDGNKANNIITNLRAVTNQQNQFNQKNAKGCYYKETRKKWEAKISINRKSKHLGYFNTEQEARQAYLEAKKLYHKI